MRKTKFPKRRPGEPRFYYSGLPIYIWLPLLPILLPLQILFIIVFACIPALIQFLSDLISGEFALERKARKQNKKP